MDKMKQAALDKAFRSMSSSYVVEVNHSILVGPFGTADEAADWTVGRELTSWVIREVSGLGSKRWSA